jgi:hypothetical protein
MDSSVSPERKVYGRVPEPPPRFAAFIGIPLDPVLAFAFLFSLETNVPRFCPIRFPIRLQSSSRHSKTHHADDLLDRNEKNKSALSLSLFLSSLERKTRKGNKV